MQNQAETQFDVKATGLFERLCLHIGSNIETTLTRIRNEQRGEGLVSFLLIVVAVAVIALYVLGVFEAEIQSRVSELDLGEAPSPGSRN